MQVWRWEVASARMMQQREPIEGEDQPLSCSGATRSCVGSRAGGMGEIFLAKMRGAAGFEKRVIIKTILPHLAEEPEFITKFLDEGRLVVQLVHGNIVPVFDMGEQEGTYFLAMEYVAGRDLRDVLRRQRLDADRAGLPVEIALHIIQRGVQGIGLRAPQGQRRGWATLAARPPRRLALERADLERGEVKIIDFGIARATGKLSRTAVGSIQGKFCYMSPEQASGRPVDARSDVFRCGRRALRDAHGHAPLRGRLGHGDAGAGASRRVRASQCHRAHDPRGDRRDFGARHGA